MAPGIAFIGRMIIQIFILIGATDINIFDPHKLA